MITNPIIPIPVMIIISLIVLLLIFKTSRKRKLIIRVLIVIVLFIINLRFMIPNGEVEIVHNNIDMIFVIDNTISMDAMDYNGSYTRLDGVKKDVKYIIEQVPGAHYSLISYTTKAVIKMPLTSDTNALFASVNTLKTPDELYAKGSTVTIFKDELEMMLNSSKKKDGHVRVVFVFSDGEATSEDEQISVKSLSNLIDGGAVLGYGTNQGGKMQKEDYKGNKSYIQDRTSYPYKDAISKIDENNLKKISKELGIDYVHMVKSDNIDSVLKKVNKIKSTSDSEIETSYKDVYYYISPILIVLILMELLLDRRSYL